MRAGYVIGAAAVLVASVLGGAPRALAQDNECLVEMQEQATGPVPDLGTLCATAVNKVCTFNLRLCRDQPGCPAATFQKKLKAKGLCRGIGRLQLSPSAASCGGAFTGLHVRARRHGTLARQRTIKVRAASSAHP